MSRSIKTILKITALLLVVVLMGIGVYLGYNHFMKQSYPLEYEEYVQPICERFQVEPALVYAVIRCESGFDAQAQSHADAHGLMQLIPSTFEWLQNLLPPDREMTLEDLYDPEVNITYGVYFLSFLLDRYDGDETLSLSAYNAGVGIVDQWLQQEDVSSDGKTLDRIPYEETSAYVERVLQSKEMYEKLYFHGE